MEPPPAAAASHLRGFVHCCEKEHRERLVGTPVVQGVGMDAVRSGQHDRLGVSQPDCRTEPQPPDDDAFDPELSADRDPLFYVFGSGRGKARGSAKGDGALPTTGQVGTAKKVDFTSLASTWERQSTPGRRMMSGMRTIRKFMETSGVQKRGRRLVHHGRRSFQFSEWRSWPKPSARDGAGARG